MMNDNLCEMKRGIPMENPCEGMTVVIGQIKTNLSVVYEKVGRVNSICFGKTSESANLCEVDCMEADVFELRRLVGILDEEVNFMMGRIGI